MSGLQIQYSKEVARELTKIAVCLPGAPVAVGDVIFFPFGQRGMWPFRKPAPRGSFNLVSSLSRLGIEAATTGPDNDRDPYIFASRRTVKVDGDFAADAGAANASGSIRAAFNKDGSVYLAGIDCTTDRLADLGQVQVDLEQHAREIIWKDTFLVTSVTVARRALIMQSSTSDASLEVSGDVKGLVTGSGADISADANISVKNFRHSSFIKPWSANVTLFMGLHRFSKEVFGYRPDSRVNRLAALDDVELGNIAGELVSSDQDRFILEPVSALEILDDADLEEP